MKYTAEAVTCYHVDKLADQISDLIVDKCLELDPYSRVAIETVVGHGSIYLVGEMTTESEFDISSVVKKYLEKIKVSGIKKLRTSIVKQSPDISKGVDHGGAGDQGVMIGYACNENEYYLPNELAIARELLAPFKVDGKSQVTIDNGKITDIVLSVQGKTKKELWDYLRTFPLLKEAKLYCNHTGAFEVGGWDADSGCTGRKIVIDQYGPRVPVGGGAFSGKDATKVDRSGAYMARYIALDLLKKYGMDEVIVKLGYVIGRAEPLMKEVELIKNGQLERIPVSLDEYDCQPEAIIERFDLRQPIYLDLARNGHFGRKELAWEK